MAPNMGNMRSPYAGGGAPFNPGNVPQPGYYNNNAMGHGPPQSPARMGMGGMMDPQMRMGGGMGMGGMMGPGPDMHMSMQPGMGMNPNVRGGMPMMAPPNPTRRVTRGSMYDDSAYNPAMGQ